SAESACARHLRPSAPGSANAAHPPRRRGSTSPVARHSARHRPHDPIVLPSHVSLGLPLVGVNAPCVPAVWLRGVPESEREAIPAPGACLSCGGGTCRVSACQGCVTAALESPAGWACNYFGLPYISVHRNIRLDAAGSGGA